MRSSGPFCPHCGKLAVLKRGIVACGVCGRSFAISAEDDRPAGVLQYQSVGSVRKPTPEPSASRSMICALLGWLTPVPSVLAVWYGVKSMERYPRGVAYPGKWLAICGTMIGLLALLIGWPMVVWAWLILGSMSADLACATQWRMLGHSIINYENEHRSMPMRLVDAITDETFRSALVCPRDRERSRDLPWEEQSSYVYIGQGVNLRAVNYEYPILYEPGPPHDGSKPSVLFADFHGERPLPADAVAAVQLTEDTRVWTDNAATQPVLEDSP